MNAVRAKTFSGAIAAIAVATLLSGCGADPRAQEPLQKQELGDVGPGRTAYLDYVLGNDLAADGSAQNNDSNDVSDVTPGDSDDAADSEIGTGDTEVGVGDAGEAEPEVPDVPAPPVGDGDDTDGESETSPNPPIGDPGPVTNGHAGTFPSLTNEEVDMASYSGKPTVVYFWAPNCSICESRAKALTSLKKDNRGISFLTAAMGGKSTAVLERFISDNKVNVHANIDDRKLDAARQYGVQRSNSWVLISPDGSYTVQAGGKLSDIEAWIATQK